MELTPRVKVELVILGLLLSFALGRYTVPEKVKIETKIQTVIKEVEKKDTHAEKKVVIIRLPSGETRTEITQVRDSKLNLSNNTKMDSDVTKEVTKAPDKVTIMALGSLNLGSLGSNSLAYGAMVSRPILGPITLGIGGLSNGIGMFGAGITF